MSSESSRPYRVDNCGSCFRPIIWCVTARARRMPVDAEPSDRGNVKVIERKGIASPMVQIIPAAKLLEAKQAGVQLHTSHFATCPNAAAHRQAGRAR